MRFGPKTHFYLFSIWKSFFVYFYFKIGTQLNGIYS